MLFLRDDGMQIYWYVSLGIYHRLTITQENDEQIKHSAKLL